MKFLTTIFLFAWLIFSVTDANAQTAELDTLYYFNPDSLRDCGGGIYTGNIDGFATYFTTPVDWPHYDLIEFQVLVHNDSMITEVGLYIYTGESDIEQSTPIELITISIQDSTERYPNWKTIDLTGYASLAGLSGNFWIRDGVLWSALCASPPTGHSFVYSFILGWQWRIRSDFAVKAIVKKNDTIGIEQSNGANELLPTEFDIHRAYPNPFNSTITFAIDIPAGNEEQVEFTIYDIQGRSIHNFATEQILPGRYSYQWHGQVADMKPAPSGLYIAVLKGGMRMVSMKILLLK